MVAGPVLFHEHGFPTPADSPAGAVGQGRHQRQRLPSSPDQRSTIERSIDPRRFAALRQRNESGNRP
jgi:hypothetical protein